MPLKSVSISFESKPGHRCKLLKFTQFSPSSCHQSPLVDSNPPPPPPFLFNLHKENTPTAKSQAPLDMATCPEARQCMQCQLAVNCSAGVFHHIHQKLTTRQPRDKTTDKDLLNCIFSGKSCQIFPICSKFV